MVGGCQKKEPGAGMDSSLGLKTVYKDGYFHLRCMMDKMLTAADWHDELQREHKYNVHTNVSIVRYTDRVDVEKQQSMTPSICFEFCRTVPDMLHFGLTAGRDCYCTPYYMQGPGDGVCDAGCEGDSSVTCGNTNGMSDIYEMHSCNDVIADAKAAYDAAVDVQSDAYDMVDYGNDVLDGSKAATDDIDDKELREGMMEFSTFINKEVMTLSDTIAECETLMDDVDSKAAAAPADPMDYDVLGPIDEAKDAMKTCVLAMKQQIDNAPTALAQFDPAAAASRSYARPPVFEHIEDEAEGSFDADEYDAQRYIFCSRAYMFDAAVRRSRPMSRRQPS